MFRLQVTTIRQTFMYMGMTCLAPQCGIPCCLHLLCRISDLMMINWSILRGYNIFNNVFSKISTNLLMLAYQLKFKNLKPSTLSTYVSWKS